MRRNDSIEWNTQYDRIEPDDNPPSYYEHLAKGRRRADVVIVTLWKSGRIDSYRLAEWQVGWRMWTTECRRNGRDTRGKVTLA